MKTSSRKLIKVTKKHINLDFSKLSKSMNLFGEITDHSKE